MCAACALREKWTSAQTGRTLQRHEQAGHVALGQQIARREPARRDRRRRQHLMEGSFGRAASEHGFKRSRWRRLWRPEIQDWLIAAVQNVKTLLRAGGEGIESGAAAVRAAVGRLIWDGGLCVSRRGTTLRMAFAARGHSQPSPAPNSKLLSR